MEQTKKEPQEEHNEPAEETQERSCSPRERRGELKRSFVNAAEKNIQMDWTVRKLNEREQDYLMDVESTQRFLDLLFAVAFFALLIFVADFFTFKLETVFEFAWLIYIPLGLAGFFNLLYVLRKHDHTIWAIKAGCDVSDAVVLYRRLLFFGKRSAQQRGVCTVYCTSAAGNNKVYRPFMTRFDYLKDFKYNSSAVILWVDGIDKPDKAFAVKMRY